ncbi:MAG: 3-dehydroquinate synthase [Abditibacteriota bacterium]|nr:3-dehydroquinate synthase [Abditibacteriota bacterium]
MADIYVNSSGGAYDVVVESGAWDRAASVIAEKTAPSKVMIITDTTVASAQGARIDALKESMLCDTSSFVMPAGERYKTLVTLGGIMSAMVEAGLDRRSAVLAVGGGVVGDVAGFAAAVYMRGIDVYQFPTTLLAMVDSSVGGKTAVDLPEGKNLVGAFKSPRGVFADTTVLETLNEREILCGLAESAKYGIILDKGYFEYLKANAGMATEKECLDRQVCRCVELKRDIVARDEFEGGVRALLNYGHTVGHALEVLGGFERFRHGEAVSVGMVTAALVAEEIGFGEKGLASEAAEYLSALNLPTAMGSDMDAGDIIDVMRRDKKNLGGSLRMALPRAIGEGEVVSDVPVSAVKSAIMKHKSLYG